jgi:hypothetical protein
LELNALIPGIANDLDIEPVVDLFDAFDGRPSLLGPDGLHPTEKGYGVIAETFFDAIVDRLELNSSHTFSDDPIVLGTTLVKTTHINEMRNAIDDLREAVGLDEFGFADPTLTPGLSIAQAMHVLELREALEEVYEELGFGTPSYTDPGLAAGALIRSVHIAEIRAAIAALE